MYLNYHNVQGSFLLVRPTQCVYPCTCTYLICAHACLCTYTARPYIYAHVHVCSATTARGTESVGVTHVSHTILEFFSPNGNNSLLIPSSLTQSCLKGLYLSWLIDTLPIENLIADLLTQFTLPPVNCLPVKRQFGALREIVLPPIHEEISLPYTSTGAYKLLQSIG